MDSDEFKAQQQAIQGALVAVNRSVNGIAAEDLTFLRTVNPDIAAQIDGQAARLLALSNALLASAADAAGRRAAPVLDDADDIDAQWRGVVDVIDALLERADTTLDEYTGLLKRKDAPTDAPPPEPKSARLDWSLRRANMDKPQERFERRPDNFDEGPWKPLLSAKPHATYVPLPDALTTFTDDFGHVQYRHPYETEIARLQYPARVFHKTAPIPFQPIGASRAVWVDTWAGVEAMLAELRQADEIAVDLEHHDFRTYAGLLSLMQISTRDRDWIVDTLQPWRHRLEALNEVFCDPAKIKVFHGASSDIVWLQRDLGLYVVGLFDTYFACDVLGYSKRSLAFLLERFANLEADKKYQMADWRIRPLSDEMLDYARADTHYLLYIYDMVRNELADKSRAGGGDRPAMAAGDADLTAYVLRKSKETSLLRHEALLCDATTGQGARGWLNALVKSYTMLSGEQFSVYRALYAWRDRLARRLDESTGYLMPNRVLADIARVLPPDQKALLALLGHTAARPTKAALGELLVVVQEARAAGRDGPTSIEFLRSDAISALVKTPRHGPPSSTTKAPAVPVARDRAALPDVTDLRSTFSQLWGERGAAMTHDEPLADAEAPWYVQAALAGPVPVEPATSLPDATTTPSAPKTRAPEDYEYITLQSPAVGASPKDKDDDNKKDENKKDEKEEAFTLKWGKGKGKEVDKSRNKDKDKNKTEASSDSDGGAPVDPDFVPFNYDTAGSVLKANTTAPAARKRGKRVFNPYGGQGDEGPKPARRMHHEKMGKSGTFK